MQETSELYQDIIAGSHWAETRLAIGETGRLLTESGETITFGGTRILVGVSGADGGYDESMLLQDGLQTSRFVFSGTTPSVGGCISGEISVEMLLPSGSIPRQARMVPYVRLTDGTRSSEWIQKGVYYVDTREISDYGSDLKKLTLHGYDDMMKAEQDYPASKLQWPAADIDVVREIAGFMGVPIDSRTVDIMANGYQIPYTTGYSCREILGYIAAMYAGCFTMSDAGALRLIALNGIPKETRYLIAAAGEPITFGGVRILV